MALICALIVLLATACAVVTSPAVPSTPTLVLSVATATPEPPAATATPLPSTATATPGQPDCTGPNAFPTEEATLVWPELREVEPDRVTPGEKVSIRGTGGHLYWDNECGESYVESAREFRLYLDGDQVGFISCYANTCMADLVVPDDVPAGVHTLSVEGGSSLRIEVTGNATPTPLPTRPSTPAPYATTVGPHISTFQVTPLQVDPGDSITLTWEAHGERATICPSARYVLFTEKDCLEVALSGVTTFTIPPETEGFQFVDLTLRVEAPGATAPAVWQATVALKCHTTWFFSDQSQAGICPVDPLRSYAAAQRFERGTMIWIEQLGRYIILCDALLVDGEMRKEVAYVHDPLEIVRDTSAEVRPPDGLHAPVSGFGLVWRGDVRSSPGYRDRLGWALAPEFGYEAVFQCDDARPSGGRSWQTCYLAGPDGEVIVFHPLGGWYLLGE